MTTTHWLWLLAFLPTFCLVVLMAVLKVLRARKLEAIAHKLEMNPGNTAVEQEAIRRLRDIA